MLAVRAAAVPATPLSRFAQRCFLRVKRFAGIGSCARKHPTQRPRGRRGRSKRDVSVILRQDLTNLGPRGTVASVRPGYARNFLIPTGQAVYATPEALVSLEQEADKLVRAVVLPSRRLGDARSIGARLTHRVATQRQFHEERAAVTELKRLRRRYMRMKLFFNRGPVTCVCPPSRLRFGIRLTCHCVCSKETVLQCVIGQYGLDITPEQVDLPGDPITAPGKYEVVFRPLEGLEIRRFVTLGAEDEDVYAAMAFYQGDK